MKKAKILVSLVLGLILCVSSALSEDEIIIQSRLFRGFRAQPAAQKGPSIIVQSFPGPVIFPMQTRGINDTDLWISALKNDLANVYQLKRVDYLVSSLMHWDMVKTSLSEAILLENDIYEINLSPRLLANGTVSLTIDIEQYNVEQLWLSTGEAAINPSSGTGILTEAQLNSIEAPKGKFEKDILNTEVIMNYDDPVVLGFPANDKSYFLSLLLKKGTKVEVLGGVVSGGSSYYSIIGQDPVCGKQVGRGSGVEKENIAVKSYEYKGENYLFCSLECYEKFKADPEKYIKKESSAKPEVAVQSSSNVSTPPKPIYKKDPIYPEQLMKEKIEGQVMLEVSTDEKGSVSSVHILKSLHPDLDRAAQEAIKQWKFEPVLVNGKRIRATFTMIVNFKWPGESHPQ